MRNLCFLLVFVVLSIPSIPPLRAGGILNSVSYSILPFGMSLEALPFIDPEAGLEIKAALESDSGGSAAGLTLFMDSILKAAPSGSNAKNFFVPADMNTADKRRFRDERWTILTGLSMVPDDPARACRLGCRNLAVDAKITELS